MLDTGAFSVYQDSEFRVIGGEYEIQVGASLQDIRLSESICVEGVKLQCPLTIHTSIPLSEEDFDAVYTYQRTCFRIRNRVSSQRKIRCGRCSRIQPRQESGVV